MIRTQNLTKDYGAVRAVRDLSLRLSPDEVLMVLGPSGCGKTTLLRLIAGLERPDAGTVVIDEQVVSSRRKMFPPNQRRLGMIFQDLALWPHLSVSANIAFGLKGRGLTQQQLTERVEETLNQVTLHDCARRYPHQLSGGQKQRLAVARALATRPAYLLMDEPFSSLDAVLKKELTTLLINFRQQFRMGIIYVTHNLDEALGLADRIAVMRDGTLIDMIDRTEFSSFSQDDLFGWYAKCL